MSSLHTERRDNSTAFSFAIFLACAIICVSIASSYLYVANTHNIIWDNAKLYQAGVKKEITSNYCTKKKTYTTCKTNYNYHIQEYFERASFQNGTYTPMNEFTIVNRLYQYSYYESAFNHVKTIKLGTYRKLYLSSLSSYSGTAYDQTIIEYYQTVGYVLFSIFAIVFCVLLCILFIIAENDWKNNFFLKHPDLRDTNYFLTISDEELAKSTNMSFSFMPRWWNIFWKLADTDESGVISITEFFAAIAAVFVSLLRSLFHAIVEAFVYCTSCCCSRKNTTTHEIELPENLFGVTEV
jgi:hypothetical protein